MTASTVAHLRASRDFGHSDLSTTMRHCGHCASDELAAAFEAH